MKKTIAGVVIFLLVIGVAVYVYQANQTIKPQTEPEAILPPKEETPPPPVQPTVPSPLPTLESQQPPLAPSEASAPEAAGPADQQALDEKTAQGPGEKGRREAKDRKSRRDSKVSMGVQQKGKMAPSSPAHPIASPSVAEQAAAVTPAGPSCWIAHYQHKFVASHQDAELCMYHKNQIALPTTHGAINPSSICAKANGVPVHFQAISANELLIAPGPNLKTDVSVQFCLEHVTCSEPCQVKKNKFMAAIGADDEDEDELLGAKKKTAAHWGANERARSQKEIQLDRELDRLDRDTEEDKKKMSIFKDWIKKSEDVSCKGKEKTRR